jgi:hypothetical protein
MKYSAVVTWMDSRKETYVFDSYRISEGCLQLTHPHYEGPLIIPLENVRIAIIDKDFS